jgi:hypothetical protein
MTQLPCAGRARPRAQLAMILALGAGSLALVGCEGDQGFVALRPKLVLDPAAGSTLTFEDVVIGRTTAEPQVVQVRNTGDGTLIFSAVQVEGEGAGALFVSSAPEQLNPGARGEIFIRFEPTLPGDYTARLVVESNDGTTPRAELTLVGVAKDPCALALTPAHQSFLLGEIKTLTIENASASDCRVNNILTDRALFDFVEAPELPLDIPAHASHTLEIQHVNVTRSPGVPVREIRVKESQGTEAVATFSGEPPVYGCFQVFPTNIIFPRTDVGTEIQRRVTVTNTCGRDAAVSSAVIGGGFYYFSVDRTLFPMIVPAQSSVDIWVTYHPFSSAGDLGSLVVNTNDAANPRFRVELYGEAALPDLETLPRGLDFGTVVFRNPAGPTNRSECGSRTQVVQVYSTGDADLVIDRLEVDPTGSQDFLISGALLNGQPVTDLTQPIVVPSGQELRVSILFYPTRADPPQHRSALRIHHNANDRLSEVVLLGQGAPDGVVTDVFEQLEGPKVDILWVIDDSCSMYDEQARLIANLSQFVGYADTLNADYQMAVTTTDAGSENAGKFERCFPHPAIIDSSYGDDTADPSARRQAAFACTFDVGTNGSGYEAGLGSAKRALERATDPALDPATNPNRGFVRPDANLAIVVMSDEEDQSVEADDVLRDFFYSVKGAHRPDRVAVHAIAGPVSEPCEAEGRFPPQPGYRYFNMTRETGGIFFNICRPDWQPVLQQLGLDVFTPTDEWDLSQAADPGTIQVTVDGLAVQPGLQNGWSYNLVGNSVKFNGSAVPTPGAQVVITYSGLCRP